MYTLYIHMLLVFPLKINEEKVTRVKLWTNMHPPEAKRANPHVIVHF